MPIVGQSFRPGINGYASAGSHCNTRRLSSSFVAAVTVTEWKGVCVNELEGLKDPHCARAVFYFIKLEFVKATQTFLPACA